MQSQKSQDSFLEVLNPELLEHKRDVAMIDHWLRVLNRSNGWHYDLDIIWILEQLRSRGVQPGATLLDAGAGIGITQFILAALGYNVISLDYTLREIPPLTKGIFNIESQQEAFDGDHEYMRFMTFGQRTSWKRFVRPDKIFKAITHPSHLSFFLQRKLADTFNLSRLRELSADHSKFGKITFLRASFNEIPLADHSVDAVISVSAFEHNSYESMPTAASEFQRIVKKSGIMLVTTSLAGAQDWYFEPAKGWNFTVPSLKKWFGIEETKGQEFPEALETIQNSPTLEKRIPKYYQSNEQSGLPRGNLKNAKYVPVGICKVIH